MTPISIAIAGGSIGGLCAGVAMRSIGHDPVIHERSNHEMSSRGAGIVVQPELLRVIGLIPGEALPVTTCSFRQYAKSGEATARLLHAPQQFTSWEAIYSTLRKGIPDDRYRLGSALNKSESFEKTTLAYFNDEPWTPVDLLLCSDGFQSPARHRLLPAIVPEYAGYIAWRGVVDEEVLSSFVREYFDDKFSFCEAQSGGHMLCYFIPGEGADCQVGRRRLNWVWYVNVPAGTSLTRWLTDKDEFVHDYSLPAGSVPARNVSALRALAKSELATPFASLIELTAAPFVQVIQDLVSPQMVFGRTCLLGDASAIVRPHTAAATAKAAGDALSLAEALHNRKGSIDEALAKWEQDRLSYSRSLSNYGIALGKRTHP